MSAHNHSPGIQDTMLNFEAFCEKEGHRITPPRRHVLQIIAKSKKPMGAYDVLEELGQYLDNPKPPTAYRAIEFLLEHRFIHRIESLNAYIACAAGHKHQGSQYMICDGCGRVEEMHLCSLPAPLQKKAEAGNFTLSYWNTELHGLCAKCAPA